MHQTIKNLNLINKELELISSKLPSIIAVSKTFPISNILPLIENGHSHFGENKVQEALEKWKNIKENFNHVKLHMLGKLQSNKVKFALPLFDFIHSLDNEKLAKKISDEQKNYEKKPKIFIQINLGNESQKSGIKKGDLKDFHLYCKEIDLDIIGLMCIPPVEEDPNFFFKELNQLNKNLDLKELSMGMSADYIKAAKNFSTFLRIGSKIFGNRS
jgi:pyridoxal phosphate enzyme (YggS family)|tara:strand:+ start:40 stop:684 length:645 start_codon:yes stop_codon:yes gene_type:complete